MVGMASRETKRLYPGGWAEAEGTACAQRDRTVLELSQTDIPGIPKNIRAVLSLCGNTTSGASELSEAVLGDYGLTVRFLRKANSSYFSPGRKQVLSMRYIVVLLGLNNVAQITRSIPLLPVEGRRGKALQETPFAHLTARSILASSLAGSLASIAKQDQDGLACIAMLQHLGDVLMSLALPRTYELFWKMRKHPANADKMARHLAGTTPGDLGVVVARRWNLPPILRLNLAPHRPHVPQLRPGLRQALAISTGINSLLVLAGLPVPSKKKKEAAREQLRGALQTDERRLRSALERGLVAFEKQNPFLYEILRRQEFLFRLMT